MSSSTSSSGSTPAAGVRPDPRWGTADVEAIIAAIEAAAPRYDDLRDCPHVPADVNPADHLLPAPPMTERQRAAGNDHALPGFGEPTPICGELIPEAMYVCPECGTVHEKPHICKRRDCPQHAPHGIRELLLGVDGAIGQAAKFGGLLGLLISSRDHSQTPQTLFLSPPPGWVTESKYPLQRTFDLVGTIMGNLADEPGADFLEGDGLQGRVTYHPVRGDHEEPGKDDRGEWKKRLFKERDWLGDVAPEVEVSPHFHVRAVGYADVKSRRVVDLEALEAGREEFVERVAVRGIDYELIGGEVVPLERLEEGEAVMSVTAIIEERTGWVIVRQEDDAGRSMHHSNHHQQRIKIAAALAYDQSHALVYTDSNGDRRLASRWKGPDLNRITTNDLEEQHQAAVYEACIDTLGIDPPDMECHTPDVEVVAAGEGEWSFSSARSSSAASSSTGSTSGTASTGGAAGRATSLPAAGQEVTASVDECGGDLVWIGDVDVALLVALERDGVDTGDLEAAYRSFKTYMAAKRLAQLAGLYPEQGDRPPPDEPAL